MKDTKIFVMAVTVPLLVPEVCQEFQTDVPSFFDTDLEIRNIREQPLIL